MPDDKEIDYTSTLDPISFQKLNEISRIAETAAAIQIPVIDSSRIAKNLTSLHEMIDSSAIAKSIAYLSDPIVDPGTISKITASMQDTYINFSKAAEIVANYQKPIIDISKIVDLQQVMSASLGSAFADLSSVAIESARESIEMASRYLSDEHHEKVESVALELASEEPATKVPAHRRLSVSDWIGLLNILVTLILAVLSYLPDPQLDELIHEETIVIEQQEALLNQQSEEIQVLKQLLESANYVSDVLDVLNQETDTVVDSLDDGSSQVLNLDEVTYDTVNSPDPDKEPQGDDALHCTQKTEK